MSNYNKNDKIIDAWDKMKPGEEIKEQIFDEIMQRQQEQKKSPAFANMFKPAKIIATAAAIIMVVGLINIQTVIAFVGGLFFVPGIGIISSDAGISAVSLSEPIDIETDRGLMTLQFMTKITRGNNTSDLVFFVEEDGARGHGGATVTINTGEEIIEIRNYGGSGGGGKTSYNYTYTDFPDVNKFDLTIRGATIPIVLKEQENSFVLSKENNGVTIALHKFPHVTSFVGIDIIDKKINPDDYDTYVLYLPYEQEQFYGEAGERIEMTGGSSSSGNGFKTNLIVLNENTSEIKGLKSNAVEINYTEKDRTVISIPIPEDGETIYPADCQVTIAGHIYKITEVKREGNKLYYKDNASYESLHILDEDPVKLQEAVENNEAHLLMAALMPLLITNISHGYDENNEWQIFTGIDKLDADATTLDCAIWFLRVMQFGDFDVTFD